MNCPYCGRLVDYADHLGACTAVAFALDPQYTGPYMAQTAGESLSDFARRRVDVKMGRQPLAGRNVGGRPKSGPGRDGSHDESPCTVPGCDLPRTRSRSQCARHEAERLHDQRQKHRRTGAARRVG